MNQFSSLIWHDLPAWALENENVRVVVVPILGAKIVSLFDKTAGYEWLVGPMRPPHPAGYGASFVNQDMAGWDEMYPTIDSCLYPQPGAYAGRSLPDHGELWGIPWTAQEVSADALTFSGEGHALPYTFTRRIRLLESTGMVFDYSITNTGSETFSGFWTAHPQFRADPGTTVQLPPEVTEVISVKEDVWWGKPGAHLAWPKAVTRQGRTLTYNCSQPGITAASHKYYLLPQIHVDQARLVTSHGNWLSLNWDTRAMPYLGIWIDEHQFNPAPVIALEPSAGYFDRLDNAVALGHCPTVQPGATLSWQITLTFGS